MKATVFAWNSRRLLVETLDGSADDQIDVVVRLCRALHHRRTDSRWQIVDGALVVKVRGRSRSRRKSKAVRK